MSILMIFLFTHQIVSTYGQSTNSVKIWRSDISGKQEDRFELRKPFERCKNQNECNHFNANLSPEASKRGRCFCSCSREMAATFGIKNGSWQCIGNKEIRERVLDACKGIYYFVNELETDPLRMYKVRQSAALNISLDIQCSEKAARFSYQACNGGWKPLDNAASAWGLQVTKQTLNLFQDYVLKIANANQSKDLEGKVIKLAIPCGSEKPFCWLFKVAGFMTCPLKPILPTSIPSKPRTTTTTTSSSLSATATTTTTTTSRRTKAVFSVAPKHTALTATKVPITTISIGKATNPWPTDSDIETVNEASHDVSIPFIAGTAGSAVIVLLIALFIGLLVCRKRKRRHTRKSSTSLELKATKTDDTIDQYTLVEENAPYQSLSPSPDGAMERGVYVSRYKVPETISEVKNPSKPVEGPKDCDEYDYAESSLVVRNNVLKIISPVHVE